MKFLNKTRPVAAVTEVYNIPRPAFLWLLAAVVGVTLPHVLRLPFWLVAVSALCVGVRYLMYQGRLSFPGPRIKVVMVLLMVSLVGGQYGSQLYSTDATVALLLSGIALKLLEMQRKRDVLLVIYLCYFTVIAEFIYAQTIPIAVYMGFTVVLSTTALMSLNQRAEGLPAWRSFRRSAFILLQSVPLMLVFFVVFPRLAPFWSVPVQSAGSRTGLSENMSPGDIGQLARSAEVAFRVQFENGTPPYNQLYWRAITLEDFDGREWTRSSGAMQQFLGAGADTRLPWFAGIEYLGDPVRYNVIMEPSDRNWVYTLQMPRIVDDRMLMRQDYQVSSRRRITQRFSYDVATHLDYRLPQSGQLGEQRRALALPPESNARARAFAQELRAANATDGEFIQAVLAHFRNKPFFYTLSPALLGEQPVDEFLFETREGFCEHYASAFTFLMRAAGIPARVVTGYMGGEFNPYDGALTVRQYDAHAWSEVWLPDEGWVRVDPTGAVAPDRIERGSDAVLQEEEEFMQDDTFSLMRFRNLLFLNELRYRLEMIDLAWNRFVLNYDQDTQLDLLNRLFGALDRTLALLLMLGLGVVLTGLIVWLYLRVPAQAHRSQAARLYLRLCDALAKQGYERAPGETPRRYMQRVLAQSPQWREELETITGLYEHIAYRETEADPERLKQLATCVRKFRLLA